MATFDQALTESALIAIPILFFLLAVGWFKYSGSNTGKPPRDADPKRDTNTTNDPSNKNTQNDSNAPNPKKGVNNNSANTNNTGNANPQPNGGAAENTNSRDDPNGSNGNGSNGGGSDGGGSNGGGSDGGGPNGGGSNGGGSNGGGSNGDGPGGGGLSEGTDENGNARRGWTQIHDPDGKHVYMIKHDPDNPINATITKTRSTSDLQDISTLASASPPVTAQPANWHRQVETPIAPEGFRLAHHGTTGHTFHNNYNTAASQSQDYRTLLGKGAPPSSAYPWGTVGLRGENALEEQQAQGRLAAAAVKPPVPIPVDHVPVQQPEAIIQSPKWVVPDLELKKKKPAKIVWEDLQDLGKASPDHVCSTHQNPPYVLY